MLIPRYLVILVAWVAFEVSGDSPLQLDLSVELEVVLWKSEHQDRFRSHQR